MVALSILFYSKDTLLEVSPTKPIMTH